MKHLASSKNNFCDIHEELYLLNLALTPSFSYLNPQMSAGGILSGFSQIGRKLRPLPPVDAPDYCCTTKFIIVLLLLSLAVSNFCTREETFSVKF